MRFFPRNRQSRHDALLGPTHVARHPRADSKTERDRLHRYERGNDGVVTATGAAHSTTALTFNGGGQTLILTVTGDDRFQLDAVTARSALLIAAFASVTNLTLTAGAFSLSADGLVLTVTIPVNTAGAASYDLSFDKTVFAYQHDTLAVVAAIVLT